jgi:hypothetical protein
VIAARAPVLPDSSDHFDNFTIMKPFTSFASVFAWLHLTRLAFRPRRLYLSGVA